MKTSELLNKTVIHLERAERVGQVSDVALDCGNRQIMGVWIGGGGLFGSGSSRFIPATAIRAVGTDAVTMTDTGEQSAVSTDGMLKLSSLLDSRIVSETGTLLGDVRGIEFDPRSLELLGIYLEPRDGRRNTPPALMPADAVMSLGDRLVIVREDTQLRMQMDNVFPSTEVAGHAALPPHSEAAPELPPPTPFQIPD